MCDHDLQQSKVIETRRDNGHVFRRRKCLCGESFVTEEQRCEGMPRSISEESLARLRRLDPPGSLRDGVRSPKPERRAAPLNWVRA